MAHKLTPRLSRAIRELLEVKQEQLGTMSDLSRRTVARFELGEEIEKNTIKRIEKALAQNGVTYIDTEDIQVIVHCKEPLSLQDYDRILQVIENEYQAILEKRLQEMLGKHLAKAKDRLQ